MKIRAAFVIFALFLSLLIFNAVAQEKPEEDFSLTKIVPEKYQRLVEESLELAGENSAQIKNFLIKTPAGQCEAASFLIAYMAPSDLACTSSIALREHLDYAFKTRNLLPWSKKVTMKLFHHYVLPCRVTQEPFEQWRKYLFERIYPRIKHLETMEEVALEINRWCAERFKYKPTQRRDQGIFENLKRGVGRCEEMMILYICAARAVGIPARACSTPLWSTCNSNHAWVEVWCDGKWFYLGACEPADTLDTAWFTLPAGRAPLVLSKIYGIPENAKNVYRRYKRSAIINTTSVYAETGKVKLDAGEGAEVYFYVFNFGSLRPFSKREADESGNIEIEFGPGQYLFTISVNDSVTKWGIVKVEPGKTAEVQYGKTPTPEGYMWLRYPKKAKKRKGKEPEKKERKPLPKYEAPPDIYKVKHFKPEDYPKVMEKIKDLKLKDKVVEALKKSLGNCENLATAIRGVSDYDLDNLLYLIGEFPVLDLIEASPEILFEHINYAKVARSLQKTAYEDEIWRKHVLHPHTGYEPLRPWRKDLFNRFHKHIDDEIAATALAVNKWIAGNVKTVEGEYAASWKNPLLVVSSRCGTKGEIRGCAIGILRSIGIPAKASKNDEWVEFYDGKEWQPLYPLEPEHLKSKKRSEAVAKEYEKPGKLTLKFKRKGSALAKFQDFAVMKLSGNYWAARWPDKETNKNGMAKMELAPGEYLFNAGVRNRNGDPYIFFKRVKIESGKEVQLKVKLDMPVEHLSREDLVVRPAIKKLPEITTRFISVPEGEQKQPYQLWVFFTLDNEPCKSMLPRINKIADGTHDLLTLYLCLGTDEKSLKEFSGEHSLGGTRKLVGFADTTESIKKLKLPVKNGKLTAMPSVMLVNSKSRRILFWEEGFNLAVDQTLEQVLELMRSRQKKSSK